MGIFKKSKSDEGFNALTADTYQYIPQDGNNLAKLIIKQDNWIDYALILNHGDDSQATDFVTAVAKFRKYGMDDEEEEFWMIALNRCSVKEARAKLFAQLATQVLIPNAISPGAKGNGYATPNRNR